MSSCGSVKSLTTWLSFAALRSLCYYLTNPLPSGSVETELLVPLAATMEPIIFLTDAPHHLNAALARADISLFSTMKRAYKGLRDGLETCRV